MNQKDFATLMRVPAPTVTKWKQRGWLVMAGDCEVDVEASKARLLEKRGTLKKMSKREASKLSGWSRSPHCTTHRALQLHREFNGG